MRVSVTPERRFTLLVNPAAGGGRGHRTAGQVERHLRALGADVRVLAAGSLEQSEDWAHEAVAADPSPEHCLVAVGGDGTVHGAVQAVAESPVLLGVVPAGSGDDAARAWGVPRGDPVAAAEVLLQVSPVPVDLGCAVSADGGVRWFATVLATGFDARVTERSLSMMGRPGLLRYVGAVAAELRTLRPLHYRLVVDGHAEHLDAMLVSVANGPSFGGGMKVCPTADPVDGKVELFILHPLRRADFVRVFPRVYTGSHLSHPAVEVRRVSEVLVDGPDVVAYVDGERVGPLPQTMSARPGAARVLTPAVPPPPVRAEGLG